VNRAALLRSSSLAFLSLLAQCSSPPAQPTGPQPVPGEQTCDPAAVQAYKLTFDPPAIVVAPGESRPVRLILDPDVCIPSTVTFASSDESIVKSPPMAQVDLRHATYDFTVVGGSLPDSSPHKITLTATLNGPDGKPYVNQDTTQAVGTLPVDVRPPTLPACSSGDATTGTLSGAAVTLNGKGTIANASIGSTANAFARTDWLKLPAFDASIACAADLVGPSGIDYQPLSQAVDFEPKTQLSAITPLRRELDFAIPINPAAFPSAARMRHLEVLFSNARAKKPRPITIASPRIEATPDGNWVLRFSAPWFGTYQAVTRKDSGTRTHMRHLTHRAVIGFSMGGGGSATFGVRHHDQFDAIAPMGGPSDWTWLLWFVEHYAMGGFCPASDPNCTKYAPSDYPMTETYAHSEDFEHWWYENGSGNGGHFSRSDYLQIFTDLALMMNNSNGDSTDPKIPYFAAGPKSTDPWVVGDTTGLQFPSTTHCGFTLSPLSGPDNANENAIESQCAQTRCDPSRTFIVPNGYYDDEYNPNGTQQVISFCDGPQLGDANNHAASPYEDTWQPITSPSQAYPMNLALAVDLNKNGVRDQGEPVIRSAHEPWDDCGTDGLCDPQEPGYDAVANPDPDGDDYDFQINPTGTEGDHRYQQGEPFKDYGLDGVQGTASSPYDKGEGDGKFTLASGLANFYEADPHSILRGWSTLAAPFTDDELSRFSIWSDGGVRDLFNFAAVANHFEGAIASRRTSDGHLLKSVAFYNGFNMLPGQDPTSPDTFLPAAIRWADLAGAPSLRYGNVDASPQDILNGDGMHVGTGAQILYRIEAAFYYVAQQWPDADRLLTNPSKDNPETTTSNELGTSCEMLGHCETNFTGSAATNNRTGPIAITLPPGYALEENRLRDVRYPVVFVLHGYGQKPEDLEALQIISNNFMNDGTRSYNSRLAKFIAVYIDGRCRVAGGPNAQEGADETQQPECIQGGFYLDSVRPNGPKFDTWFDEVVQYIDKNYRTMPASDVTVTE